MSKNKMKELKELQQLIGRYSSAKTEIKEIDGELRVYVGGSLGLDGLSSIPEDFNPTVGGSLGLRGLTRMPEFHQESRNIKERVFYSRSNRNAN